MHFEISEATMQFVSQHAHDDVRMLALRGCKDPAVDLPFALQQIAGRQTAQHKLPTWAATDGIVYPPRLSMEQCSSEATAKYKAEVVREAYNSHISHSPHNSHSPHSSHISHISHISHSSHISHISHESHKSQLIDLTGGFGVDFAFMSEVFDEAVYVERDEQLCAIAAHNFRILGLSNVTTVCADASAFSFVCADASAFPFVCADASAFSFVCPDASAFPFVCADASAFSFVCPDASAFPFVCPDASAFSFSFVVPAESRAAVTPASLPAVAPLVIYLDPARRDTLGSAQIVNGNFVSRKYSALADCTPNVIAMMPDLMHHADYVLLKLSPMLDWRKAVADLAPHHVSQVHIVAVDNECKELLLLLDSDGAAGANGVNGVNGAAGEPLLVCTDIHSRDGSRTSYSPGMSNHSPSLAGTSSLFSPHLAGEGLGVGSFLYEPNAAVMKAGCFRDLATDFAVVPLADNSHLFTAGRLISDFPGRCFRITAICTMNKRELHATLGHLQRANITVRNFPLTAQQLRQRLKLADGGSDHIFATTTANGQHILILSTRI